MFWVKDGLVHPLTRTARIRAQTSPVKHNSHLFMELNATQHSYNFPTSQTCRLRNSWSWSWHPFSTF